MRDIRVMFEALGDDGLRFERTYLDALGREKPCFHLPKELTLTLITGYSIPLRAAVVKRWQELEAQQAPTLPNFANPAEAARAWASEYEAKQLAHERIKVLEPLAAVGEQVASVSAPFSTASSKNCSSVISPVASFSSPWM